MQYFELTITGEITDDNTDLGPAKAATKDPAVAIMEQLHAMGLLNVRSVWTVVRETVKR